MDQQQQFPPMPQVVLAVRRIEGKWQSALLVRGEFDRTFAGDSLPEVVNSALAGFMDADFPNDTRVQVMLNMHIPEQPESKIVT